jgi:hypothetical protein
MANTLKIHKVHTIKAPIQGKTLQQIKAAKGVKHG